MFCIFSPTAELAMNSLAQNSSGEIRCSCNSRFRRKFRRVPEPFCADGWWDSGWFWCRLLMRFLRVPAQMADEVPEGSGADGWWGSKGFRRRWLMSFRRVPVQISGGFRCRWLMRFRRVPGAFPAWQPKLLPRELWPQLPQSIMQCVAFHSIA